MMANETGIIAGIDTHAGTHHVALIDHVGRRIADQEFPATAGGYRRIEEFITGHGPALAVGIEQTGTYGAQICRCLSAAGLDVIEVSCTDRQGRRLHGKSDPIDAYAAAEAVLAGRAGAVPKSRDGVVEAIRVLRTARSSAVKARTAATNQIKGILVAAEEEIRCKYRGMTTLRLVEALARCRPAGAIADPATATLMSLKSLARRWRDLTDEIKTLERHIDELTMLRAPEMRAIHGAGPETVAQLLITAGDNPHRIQTEAQFAALVGVAPVPASSGKTTRHRLSRGGDRAANAALHAIVLNRLGTCERTKTYAERRTREGKTTKEIMRCLKRFVAREAFRELTNPTPLPQINYRAARQNAGLTLTEIATQLGTRPSTLSRLERNMHQDRDLSNRYYDLLTNQPQAA